MQGFSLSYIHHMAKKTRTAATIICPTVLQSTISSALEGDSPNGTERTRHWGLATKAYA